MSTIELRKLLIERIQVTDNEKLLEEAYSLLEFDISDSDEYVLSESQNAAIAQSRKQIKEGKYLTNQEVNKEINKLLDK